MSNQDWNSKPTAPSLQKVELVGSLKLIVPVEVRNKIKALCRKIAKVEWSGVLFYSIEGSIQKPEEMVITLKDILLMDKGTSVYTSFDWDEDVVNFQMDNPEAMNWHIGHIHSHNTMNVFFSTTDMSELNDNSPNHNIYLSVIVNNFMDCTAKVAMVGTPKTFICKDETGKDYPLNITSNLSPFMFVWNCAIEGMDEEIPEVSEDFMSRIEAIETKAQEKAKEEYRLAQEKAKNAPAKVVNPAVQNGGWGDNSEKNRWLEWNKRNTKSPQQQEFFDDLSKKLEDYEEEVDITPEEEFAIYVLRLGNHIKEDTLELALDAIEAAELSGDSMASSILDSYGAYYTNFFEGKPDYEKDEVFMQTLEDVITFYEEEEGLYEFLTPIIIALKMLGNKFELTNLTEEQND